MCFQKGRKRLPSVEVYYHLALAFRSLLACLSISLSSPAPFLRSRLSLGATFYYFVFVKFLVAETVAVFA